MLKILKQILNKDNLRDVNSPLMNHVEQLLFVMFSSQNKILFVKRSEIKDLKGKLLSAKAFRNFIVLQSIIRGYPETSGVINQSPCFWDPISLPFVCCCMVECESRFLLSNLKKFSSPSRHGRDKFPGSFVSKQQRFLFSMC